MSLPKLVAIGSSIMQDWISVAEVFPHMSVTNLAIGGTITDDWLSRLPQVLDDHQPDAIWCYVGSNDLNRADRSAAEIADNQASLTAMAQAAGVPIAWLHTIKAPQKRPRWDDIDRLASSLVDQLGDHDRLIPSDPCLPASRLGTSKLLCRR